MFRRVVRITVGVVVGLALLVGGAGFWGYRQLTGSLPQLDGQLALAGLRAPVRIERDHLGVPTITARNRVDLAFATGFCHGQERFFQLDLLRRTAAGELAELVGGAVADVDRQHRIHRFRWRAQQVAEAPHTRADRELLEAYAQGVNAGLQSLRTVPFEYYVLRADPEPWRVEDSVLALYAMYLDLQGRDHIDEQLLGLLHDRLPAPLYEFLTPMGTEWDAPLEGAALEVAAIPTADVLDLRPQANETVPADDPAAPAAEPADEPAAAATSSASWADRFAAALLHVDADEECRPGSNNWAVAGTHTKHGGAIVANDMHLGIRVPHIWYRARFAWTDDAGTQRQITGVTLPGTPAMVVGSNGQIAWGFTNSEGDWSDLVVVEVSEDNPDEYLTPDGPRRFERVIEQIKIKGAAEQPLEIVSTIWGPIVGHDAQKRPLAQRWVAHDVEGVNLGLLRMENVESLDAALALATLCGSPHQNFVVGDRSGRIGWTIIGRMPRRVGFDGRLPTSWADGSRYWDGWLPAEEYPRFVDPPDGRIWTANARVVAGENLARLGDGGYDLGARAQQIRDDLAAIDKADEADMLKVQLDDRAVFLERWQKLLLETITDDAIAERPARREFRELVEKWGGRASTDSVGYLLVRDWRRDVLRRAIDPLVAQAKEPDKPDQDLNMRRLERVEGPLWRLVTNRPPHLLDPKYDSWQALLLTAVDTVLYEQTVGGEPLSAQTWGKRNTTRIQHPLSLGVPRLGHWLDMPSEQLPGDGADMPRIQTPTSGASERMAVSPGHEDKAYLHMPCGQSGHPLSPHYDDAQRAWCEGTPTPFLPGPTLHTLELVPAG
ncbi:MAG: penicillin acylase family protein [Pirellulales bacterium]